MQRLLTCMSRSGAFLGYILGMIRADPELSAGAVDVYLTRGSRVKTQIWPDGIRELLWAHEEELSSVICSGAITD